MLSKTAAPQTAPTTLTRSSLIQWVHQVPISQSRVIMDDARQYRFKLLLCGFVTLVVTVSAISYIVVQLLGYSPASAVANQGSNPQQVRLVLLLAGHLVIIAAAGLFVWWVHGYVRETEARTASRMRDLATSFEFSREMTATCDSETLFDSVTARAREVMSGSAAALCLVDEKKRSVYLAAGSGACSAAKGLRQSISRDIPSRVVQSGDTVVSDSTCSGCLFLQNVPDGHLVATPLRVRDSTLGALCVVRPETIAFDTEERHAFALLGNAAAVALTNVRLMEENRSQTQLAAAHNERAKLAAQLHDNLAQTLAFINFKTDRLRLRFSERPLTDHEQLAHAEEELEQVRAAVNKAYVQVRIALTDLHGSVHRPDQAQTLENRLQHCIEELQRATHMQIALEINTSYAFALSGTTQTQIIHIVREAIMNAWRHAQANQITVIAEQRADQARFVIRDDGRGFDPARVDTRNHLGLGIMRSRAARSGGNLVIESAPGQGTRIVLTFDTNPEERNPTKTEDATRIELL